MDSTISKDTFKIWSIPDPLCASGMQGVITGLNSLMIYPHKPPESGKNDNPVGETIKMYQVESFSWIWEQPARKLINEALSTFLSLQMGMRDVEADNSRQLLVKKCREYRSMIQASVEDINSSEVKRSGNGEMEDPDALYTTGQLLYKMELILGLVEIIFIDAKPGGMILGPLLNWIRCHFPQCSEKKKEALESPHPHQHPLYWEAVYGMVLQGRMDEAWQMLAQHPSAGTDPFLSIEELLRKMPIYQAYSGVTEAEFTVRWQHWQNECERRLQEAEFSTCHQLKTICQILCGDEVTINSLVDLMDTWYHLMVSTLLFTCPTIKLFRLHTAAQDAITQRGGEQMTSPLDHVLLAAMESDAHQVIKECHQVLDNSWFTFHVTDLLCHTLTQKADQKFLPELRESLLLDYASVLVSHPSLWQVGILYLDHCGSVGVAMSRTVLQRVPLTDDSRAQKVIHMAMDRNYDDIVMGVCRVMGRRALSQDRLGSAIWWGVKSRDSAFTTYLAHQILRKYVSEGKLESSPLLDHLGPAMLLSDTLTFLGKYREFHTLYQDGNFKEAAMLLVSLISSKLAPEYFWPVLLLDVLPLLKSEEPIISAEQTYELLYCLHNLCQSSDKRERKNGAEKEAICATFLEKEKELRLALTNNLANAIVHEGTVQE